MTNFHKYDAVFNLNVEVPISKKVSRNDLIMELLNEDELAFKFKDGSTACFKLDNHAIELIDILLVKPLKEKMEKLK